MLQNISYKKVVPILKNAGEGGGANVPNVFKNVWCGFFFFLFNSIKVPQRVFFNKIPKKKKFLEN